MLAIGDILNDTFRIKALIGQGGTACVYEVEHVRVPKRFALKVITGPSCSDPVFMQRFRQEAEILATLDHPHLVGLVDWNRSDQGQPYIVMELLIGEDLGRFLARTGALPPSLALPIFVQVADALRAAHEHGVVHRDLKPGNIFLCKNGAFPNFVKVLDFGIAKSVRTNVPMQTDRSIIMGTPAYMSPEQARCGMEHVDTRTDQFALAAILYEMLSGQPAFYRSGEDAVSTLIRVLTEDPPPLSYPHLDAAVRRALQKDKEQRFPRLIDFVEATGATERGSVMMMLAGKAEGGAASDITKKVQVAQSNPAPAASAEVEARPQRPASLPSYAASAQLYPVRSMRRLPTALRWSALPAILALAVVAHRILPPSLQRDVKKGEQASDSQGHNPDGGPQSPSAELEARQSAARVAREASPVERAQAIPREQPPEAQKEPPAASESAAMAEPPALAERVATDVSAAPTEPEAPLPSEPEPQDTAPAEPTSHPARRSAQTSSKASRGSRSAGSGDTAKMHDSMPPGQGVRRLTGVSERVQSDFIWQCGTELAQQRPEQVRGKLIMISRCDPACVAPGGVDREVRMVLEKCLKQWRGQPFPAANVKLFFY